MSQTDLDRVWEIMADVAGSGREQEGKGAVGAFFTSPCRGESLPRT